MTSQFNPIEFDLYFNTVNKGITNIHCLYNRFLTLQFIKRKDNEIEMGIDY